MRKEIYSLKQAYRAWFLKLSGYLLERGFKSFNLDASMILYDKESVFVFFLIYVDDILVIGNDSALSLT